MKWMSVFCSLSLVFSADKLFAQNHVMRDTESLLQDLFEPDSQTNMTIKGYITCPSYLTNSISNTNLFSLQEQQMLGKIILIYKTVTTNSGPPGTVLLTLNNTNGYFVSHFGYTNCNAHEDIMFGDRTVELRKKDSYEAYLAGFGTFTTAKFRRKNGDGYDVSIAQPDIHGVSEMTFTQIEQENISGMHVELYNDHPRTLLHFNNGKAVGKWLLWGGTGQVGKDNFLLEISIKSPIDYFKYMSQRVR